MKWFALAAAVAFLALAPSAMAGDYHKNATLSCQQCHIMHYSQSHGYNPDGSGFFSNPGAGGPFHFLLRDEVNDLCLACHDNNAIAPDVLGASNTGNEPGAVRQAGYLNRLGIEGLEPTGHTLDTLSSAPGSDPPWKPEDDNGVGQGLSCVNCHHQHGSAQGVTGGNAYRNLLTGPGPLANGQAYVSYNDTTVGTNNLTKDVFERSPAAYDESFIDFNEPVNTQSAMGKWCSGCHTDFHGTPGDANTVGGSPATDPGEWEEFLRHPTAGVNIGALGGGHSSLSQYNLHLNKVKVMSEVGVWDPAGADVTPSCMSCHKAHGNGRSYGLIYRQGTGTKTEDGDTAGNQLEDLCGQCHVQGNYFFQNP